MEFFQIGLKLEKESMFAVFCTTLTQELVVLLVELDRLLLTCPRVFSRTGEYHMDMRVVRILMSDSIPVEFFPLHIFQVTHHVARSLAPVLNGFVVGG